MKLNDLIENFSIAMSNEEAEVLEKVQGVRMLNSYTERERFVIENLIRKSLVSKITVKGNVWVTSNER